MKKLLAGVVALFAVLLALPSAAGAQSAPVITLLHGIPGVPVDVYVGGTKVIPDFQPGKTADLSSFAGQTLTNIEVKPTGSATAVITVPSLAVPASGNFTVVAHLDASGKPTITPFANDTATVPAGQGRLIVRHTAAAPAVDIVVGDARPITNLSNPNQAALVLAAGPIAGAKVAPTGGAPIADVPTVTLAAGTDLIVYAVGSVSGGTFTFYTQTIAVGELPATGAADTAVKVGAGTALALLGLGLVMVARRRTVLA